MHRHDSCHLWSFEGRQVLLRTRSIVSPDKNYRMLEDAGVGVGRFELPQLGACE
jgi:hypothetical protein